MYNKVISTSRTLSRGTHNYDTTMTSDGILTGIDNIINKRNEHIHIEAYNKAKENFLLKNPQYKEYSWIEIRNDDWYKPSNAIIIQPIWPFSKKRINLDKYWPNMNYDSTKNKWQDILISDGVPYDYEIVYIDYIKSKVKIRNRINDDIRWVDFDRLSKDMNVSANFSLDDTFSKKYNDLF